MKQFKGKAAYRGIALGTIHILKKQQYEIKPETVQDVENEWGRFLHAEKTAYTQLQDLFKLAEDNGNAEGAAIVQAQQVMLQDEEFIKSVEKNIKQYSFSAEYAVFLTGKEYTEILSGLEDEYTKARAGDVKDIAERLMKCLYHKNSEIAAVGEPVIVVAEDLTPSETIRMDKNKVLAFVTRRGSVNSHVAILAKTMNIPALVGTDIDISLLKTGMEAIVDGFTGEFIVEPEEWQKEHVKRELTESKKQQEKLQELIGKKNITLSGKKIAVFANAGSIEDIQSAMLNDAGGIGLFRSELLYIGKDRLPTEEEQFLLYKQAAELVNGKKIIIRTLDIGADKTVPYLRQEYEENPALGCRAIRMCLLQPEILKTQLRALYRAAVYGNISIMYPMITSVKEVKEIQKLSAQVKEELKAENIPYKEVNEGIMIETPAAALISDELAGMVDFFSVGTNDLAQYTTAIDRQNEKLDSFYEPYHKAVLKLIEYVVEQGHKAGILVGICGEMAADTKLTQWFVEIGVDELSTAPLSILELRRKIRSLE